MKKDEFEGELIMYFENGKIQQKGKYVNGVKRRFWMIYKETGELEQEDKYAAGVLKNPLPTNSDFFSSLKLVSLLSKS